MNKKLITGITIIIMIIMTGCTVSERVANSTTKVVEELTDKTIKEIYFNDHIGSVSKTTYEGEQAIIISDVITIDNPHSYKYQLGKADSTLARQYSYQEISKAYWIIKTQEAKLPENKSEKEIKKIIIIQTK